MSKSRCLPADCQFDVRFRLGCAWLVAAVLLAPVPIWLFS